MSDGTRRVVYLRWTASRVVMALLYAFRPMIGGDTNYYRTTMAAGHGVAHTLLEYPTAAYGLIRSVWGLAPSGPGFLLSWVGLMLAIDLAFFALLVRTRSRAATHFWILAGPALGPIVLLRFDLVPAVLVGIAALYAARHPRVAGAAVALAALVKYWPAAVLPSALRMTSRRVALTIGFVATAAVGGVVALLATGWHRQFTPLTWQSHRGLEFEAVWATPVMVMRVFRPHAYTVAESSYQSIDITGPGVSAMITAATITEVLVVLLLGHAWWQRRKDATAAHGIWLMLATICGLIVTDRVFSPQYMLWLLPAAAVALAIDARPSTYRWAQLLLATAVLTQVRYPFLQQHHVPTGVAVSAEVVRNVLVVVLFVLALGRALRPAVAD